MRRAVFAALIVLPMLAGCSRSNLVPVSGVVLFDDRPLADARVTLVPPNGGGTPAIALTDAQGRFEIETYSLGRGAAPGEYRVVITKTEDVKPGAPDLPAAGEDPAQVIIKGQEKKGRT